MLVNIFPAVFNFNIVIHDRENEFCACSVEFPLKKTETKYFEPDYLKLQSLSCLISVFKIKT